MCVGFRFQKLGCPLRDGDTELDGAEEVELARGVAGADDVCSSYHFDQKCGVA